ncbi:probable uridine nucleosidase 2 isoform X2 [Odontomachus brunneus]|uniref:probable uridine nucleosidase 2 isoform X2 n=1 Tax=Odontomachus brunneus TaxID=486640 RepID=UPI0013F1F7B0|nr:probable uridine nucleosidase 2 isoform X2 [Odontomachus brunneus]
MAMKYNIVVCMIVILLYLHVCSALSIRRPWRCRGVSKRKLIIDTDAGGDDALALMLALLYEIKTCDIEILAITCTYGNAYLEDVIQNVLKTLTVADRNDVPVYIGSVKPLINTYKFDNYFGEDGFGDFNFTERITAKVDKTKPAPMVLADLVKKYPNQITIVVLGPLTNIAVANMLHPRFIDNIKKLIIMGSNIEPDSKIEFNFEQDPESNWIVLNNTNKIHTVFPIDTVTSHSIAKEERGEIFNKIKNSFANFLSLAERVPLEKTELWGPADGMTMAIALKPEIVSETFKTNLEPVLIGNRGEVVVDPNNTVHNAEIIQSINVTAFKDLIIECLS